MKKALQHGAFPASICGDSSIVHAFVWRPAFGAPAWRRQGNIWRGWRKNRPACRRWRSAFPAFPASRRPAAHGRREALHFGTSCTAASRKYPVRRRKLLVIHTRRISHCRTPAYNPCAAHRPPEERRHHRFFRSFPSNSLSAGRGHFSKARQRGILSAPFSWQ